MKLIETELQNELLNYFEKVRTNSWTPEDGSPAYFIEQLRPKRVRRKTPEETS